MSKHTVAKLSVILKYCSIILGTLILSGPIYFWCGRDQRSLGTCPPKLCDAGEAANPAIFIIIAHMAWQIGLFKGGNIYYTGTFHLVANFTHLMMLAAHTISYIHGFFWAMPANGMHGLFSLATHTHLRCLHLKC